MTITAGAHSIQPRRRSALAPSDSGALRFLVSGVASGSAATAVSVLTGASSRHATSSRCRAIPAASERKDRNDDSFARRLAHSWHETLRVEGVLDLAGHG